MFGVSIRQTWCSPIVILYSALLMQSLVQIGARSVCFMTKLLSLKMWKSCLHGLVACLYCTCESRESSWAMLYINYRFCLCIFWFYMTLERHILFFTKVNIDIGTKILKQKCFGRKTYFPGTFFNFKPAKQIYGSSSIRSAYSRGCGTSILMSFFENSHAALDLQVGTPYKNMKQHEEITKKQTKSNKLN